MNPRREPTIEKLGDRRRKSGDNGEKVRLKLGGQYLSEEAARHHPMGARCGGESGPGQTGLARHAWIGVPPKSADGLSCLFYKLMRSGSGPH